MGGGRYLFVTFFEVQLKKSPSVLYPEFFVPTNQVFTVRWKLKRTDDDSTLFPTFYINVMCFYQL